MWAGVSSWIVNAWGQALEPGPRTRAAWKTLCLIYALWMYWALLTSEPARLVGWRFDFLPSWLRWDHAAHFLSFLGLTLLFLPLRWAIPRWVVMLCLLASTVGTEWLQSFVPLRTPEVADCVFDLAGIAAGTAVCSLVISFRHPVRRLAGTA